MGAPLSHDRRSVHDEGRLDDPRAAPHARPVARRGIARARAGDTAPLPRGDRGDLPRHSLAGGDARGRRRVARGVARATRCSSRPARGTSSSRGADGRSAPLHVRASVLARGHVLLVRRSLVLGADVVGAPGARRGRMRGTAMATTVARRAAVPSRRPGRQASARRSSVWARASPRAAAGSPATACPSREEVVEAVENAGAAVDAPSATTSASSALPTCRAARRSRRASRPQSTTRVRPSTRSRPRSTARSRTRATSRWPQARSPRPPRQALTRDRPGDGQPRGARLPTARSASELEDAAECAGLSSELARAGTWLQPRPAVLKLRWDVAESHVPDAQIFRRGRLGPHLPRAARRVDELRRGGLHAGLPRTSRAAR